MAMNNTTRAEIRAQAISGTTTILNSSLTRRRHRRRVCIENEYIGYVLTTRQLLFCFYPRKKNNNSKQKIDRRMNETEPKIIWIHI